MKKFINILLIVILSVFAVCCTPQDDGINSNEVLVNSFENYMDCYDILHSGAMEINFTSDEKYVTEGVNAALINSDPYNAGKNSSLSLSVPLVELDGTNSYRDFSKMGKVTFDLYNDSENELLVGTSFLQKKIGNLYSNVQKTVVPAKTKQTITYTVNRYEIFYALGTAGPSHVTISLSGTDILTSLDNMKISYVADSFVEPKITIDSDEIIKFEKSYQAFVTYTTGTTLKAEVVADAENASEGSRYVRIYRDGVADGVGVYGGKFGISANYLSNINFTTAPAGSYIAFDYKTGWAGNKMWTVPRLVASASNAYANIKGCSLICDTKWHTFYIPLEFAPAFFDNIELSFDGGTFGDFFVDNFRLETNIPADADIATGWGKT